MQANLDRAKIKRRNYFSKKGPQSRIIGKIVALVLLAVVMSVSITSMLFFKLSNEEFKGDVPFYYVPEGAAQQVNPPTAFDVLLPGLLICGLIMSGLTIIIGIFMSHHLCGPITNLQKGITTISEGNLNVIFKIRKNDEFQDLAKDLENMAEKIKQPIMYAQKEAAKMAENSELKQVFELNEGMKKISNNLNYFKVGK